MRFRADFLGRVDKIKLERTVILNTANRSEIQNTNATSNALI